jgi:hypothetical protein
MPPLQRPLARPGYVGAGHARPGSTALRSAAQNTPLAFGIGVLGYLPPYACMADINSAFLGSLARNRSCG